MPSQTDMLERLKAANFFSVNPEADRFLTEFTGVIGFMSGIKGVGPGGINLAWEMAMHDLPEETALKLHLNFGFVIEAITPNADFVEEVKEYRRQLIAEHEKIAQQEFRQLKNAMDAFSSSELTSFDLHLN